MDMAKRNRRQENMADNKWGSEEDMWPTVLPPFRPGEEDLATLRQACPPELLQNDATPRILVLGVTSALVNADWPAGSEIHAVDFDPDMIRTLWTDRAGTQCHCEHWQDMSFPDAHFDLVVGDCSFNALPAMADYDDVLTEVSRVMRPSAPLICRFFLQTEPPLTLDRLAAGTNGPFADYRTIARRMLILLSSALPDGTAHMSDIGDRIREQFGDVDEFFAALELSDEDLERIRMVMQHDTRLNFPNRQQVLDLFGMRFSQIDIFEPDYDCGSFCPTIRFTR